MLLMSALEDLREDGGELLLDGYYYDGKREGIWKVNSVMYSIYIGGADEWKYEEFCYINDIEKPIYQCNNEYEKEIAELEKKVIERYKSGQKKSEGVRKGEKSSEISHPVRIKVLKKNGEETIKSPPKFFRVFNLEQVEKSKENLKKVA